jgi:hypothetical protein
MQATFIGVAAIGACYFTFAKRRFDYFALAYFSALIYFLPGFFGATSFHVEGIWNDSPIHPEAYAVMMLVLVSIMGFAFIADRLLWRSSINRGWRVALAGENIAIWFIALLALIGLLGVVLTAGNKLLSPDKVEMMEVLGRWHVLYYIASAVGFAIAVHQARHVLAICFLTFLLLDLYLGFRSPLAIGLFSAVILLLNSKDRPTNRLVAHWRLGLAVLLLGCMLFAYKHVIAAVKAGLWDLVVERLTTPEAYALFITQSEPFATQHILNEVITRGFRTPPDHLVTALYQLLIFAPELGASARLFNDYFQPTLFPEVDYGLASNIWAQMWSAGGWPLLLIFVTIFNAGLLAGNASLSLRNSFLRPALTPMFVYWAFYIHRNDLSYLINLEKRILIVTFVAAMLAALLSLAARTQVIAATKQ